MSARPDASLYYWDYLQLGKLLSSQEPETGKAGEAAHDEMLFIVVHQAYELWFKQILHELDAVQAIMGMQAVPEKSMGRVVSHLRRITEIQRLLVVQIDVLETMTPLDFLDFRDELVPASGFQSVQFRIIENRLGLTTRHRLRIKGSPYTAVLSPEHVEIAEAAEAEPSLLDHVDRWLARTPFVRFGDFDFWQAYRRAVDAMLAHDRHVIETHPNLDDEAKAEQLALLDDAAESFATLFDRDRYQELVDRGKRRLSHDALLAALLIHLYRDEPIFQSPFRLLSALTDIDEGFSAWRQRHALLAHRMIGGKIGTGGTSGHDYLAAAARKHTIFRDLIDLPTFFVPRSALPELPDALREQMGFRYAGSPR